MSSITQAELRHLNTLRLKEQTLWSKLFSGPAVESAATQADIQAYTTTVEKLTRLESKLHGQALAEKMAIDRTLQRVAAEQVRAGQALIQRHNKVLMDLLRGVGTTGFDPGAIDRASRELQRAANEVIPEAMRQINLVSNTLDKGRFAQVFGSEALSRARSFGIDFATGVDRKLVQGVWKGRSRELYKLMQKQSKELKSRVFDLISAGKNSRTALKDLQAAGFPRARTSKWVRKLEQDAMEALSGSPDAKRLFRARIRQARKYAEARRGPTVGTRGASKRLLSDLTKAVKAGEEDAIKQAVTEWTNKKTLYNSITTMRTATNETYRALQNSSAREKPYVYALKFILSRGHPKQDECDFFCSADLGLGPGVYPIGMAPETHISCLCRLEPQIDRGYLSTGQPLAFRLPKGIEGKVTKLGANSDFTKLARQAKTPKEMKALMRKHGMLGNKKVKLQRLDRDAVPDDNILR